MIIKKAVFLLALTALPLLAGCEGMYAGADRGLADASTKPARQCIDAPLKETQVLDETTLYAEDAFGHASLIKMNGACLRRNEAIKIEYRGISQVCRASDVQISGFETPRFETPCFIDSVTSLTKDEAKAYRDGKKT